jgi:hypothetical protein
MKTENKIQLLHPEGKHAFRIDADKYEIMHKAILHGLKKGPLMHKELNEAVHEFIIKKKIRFEGSIEWYMEGVKLDLEAKKIVKRVKENSKLKFGLTGKVK